jgi:transcription antitermination protein NusB
MASRRKARVIAFQSIFAWEASGSKTEEILQLRWIEDEKRRKLEEEHGLFIRNMVAGTIERSDEIDAAIRKQLQKWDFDRLGRVDLAILRISTYALMFQADIPPSVTIDEAVEIAKEFGGGDSWRFVNGVLDGIRKGIGA